MKRNKEISWQVIEEVAGLLEKSLTPYAKVDRNVKLPVIGQKRTRQCDVVITYGTPPREIISIVEVQKRTKKPDITTFHGWYRKMEEVGAHNLICVSTCGFPKSIINDVANRCGPRVRLLTLNELNEPAMPGLDLVAPFILHKKPVLKLLEAGPIIKLEKFPKNKRGRIELISNEKVFTLDDSKDLQSLYDVITPAMREISKKSRKQKALEPDSYRLEINLPHVDRTLWMHIKGKKYKVLSLPIKLQVNTYISKIPLTTFEYQQEYIEGALAWVAIAEGFSEGKQISIRIIFGKDEKGFLQRMWVYKKGVESLGLLVSSEKSVVEDYVKKSLENSE